MSQLSLVDMAGSQNGEKAGNMGRTQFRVTGETNLGLL